jgi:hypothetical protein
VLASFPASTVNQKQADLGIPNRFKLSSSGFSRDGVDNCIMLSLRKLRRFCIADELRQLRHRLEDCRHGSMYANDACKSMAYRLVRQRSAFPRRAGVDRERVHAGGEFAGQCLVHHAVAFEATLSAERL